MIVPDVISDSSKVGCLCFCPWVDDNELLVLSLFVGYEEILNDLLLMSARLEGMRRPFVLSVLHGSFRHQLFNCDFVVSVSVSVSASVVAATATAAAAAATAVVE